jgi:hypothetical protein
MTTFRFTLFALVLTLSLKSQLKPAELKGKWKYLDGSGGLTGKGPGYTTEQNVIYQFSKNGTMKRFVNGKLQECSDFKLKEETLGSDPTYKSCLFFANGLRSSVKRSGDTLFIKENMADGFEYRLLRK